MKECTSNDDFLVDEKSPEQVLALMRQASTAFYQRAINIGNHAFIEFTGLMNEYIKCCAEAAAQGIDFRECNTHSGKALPMPDYSMAYINEKLECIFLGSVVLASKPNSENAPDANIHSKNADVPDELLRSDT